MGAAEAKLMTDDELLANFVERVFSELQSWLESLDSVVGSSDEIWAAEQSRLSKLVSGWITTELFKLQNESGQTMRDLKISPENFAEFLATVYLNKINSSAAQVLLREMFLTGKDPSTIIEEKDLKQIDDSSSLDLAVNAVIEANPGPVNDFKNGKEAALMYLVGQTMKATKGKGNPQKLQEIIRQRLKKDL